MVFMWVNVQAPIAMGITSQKSNIDTKHGKCLKGITFSKPSFWVPSLKLTVRTWKRMVGRWSFPQWLFLVPLIGGRWFVITQLAIYNWYISGIYCQLVDYMVPIPHTRGTKKLHWFPFWDSAPNSGVSPFAVSFQGGSIQPLVFRGVTSMNPTRVNSFDMWCFFFPLEVVATILEMVVPFRRS